MLPPSVPPPSVLPYLSSVDRGWDSLVAHAFHEPAEVEGHFLTRENDIALCLITGGELYWETREEHAHSSWDRVHLHPGDFILATGTNTRIETRWRCPSAVPTYTFGLRLSRSLLARTVEELGGGDGTQLMLVEQAGFQDPFLQQIVLSLWRELQEGAPSGKLFAQCATPLLLLHLVRHYACSGPIAAALQEEPAHRLTPQQLQRVITYIREHPGTNPTLEVLAQQTGYSPNHFSRLFLQTTGETPHQRVQRERLAHARRLLESSTLSLAEVAVASGFGDQSYFTRVFKAALRVTPAAYRRPFSSNARLSA